MHELFDAFLILSFSALVLGIEQGSDSEANDIVRLGDFYCLLNRVAESLPLWTQQELTLYALNSRSKFCIVDIVFASWQLVHFSNERKPSPLFGCVVSEWSSIRRRVVNLHCARLHLVPGPFLAMVVGKFVIGIEQIVLVNTRGSDGA